MILDGMTDKQKALIYTHLIYRDTVLEDYHAKSKQMDADFYDIIYKIVSKNVRKIERNQNILVNASNIEEFQRVVKTKYTARSIELTRFVMEIYSYSIELPGIDWDEAVLVKCDAPKDIATYILEGCFAECCRNKLTLDDETMMYLNKDVHNRIFTLISKKLL